MEKMIVWNVHYFCYSLSIFPKCRWMSLKFSTYFQMFPNFPKNKLVFVQKIPQRFPRNQKKNQQKSWGPRARVPMQMCNAYLMCAYAADLYLLQTLFGHNRQVASFALSLTSHLPPQNAKEKIMTRFQFI